MVRHLPRIDMNRTHARHPRALRLASPLERLDEHRYRRETVGIHDWSDRLRLTQPARQLDDLMEARQLARQGPAREARGLRLGILDPEIGAGMARLHALGRDVTEG